MVNFNEKRTEILNTCYGILFSSIEEGIKKQLKKKYGYDKLEDINIEYNYGYIFNTEKYEDISEYLNDKIPSEIYLHNDNFKRKIRKNGTHYFDIDAISLIYKDIDLECIITKKCILYKYDKYYTLKPYESAAAVSNDPSYYKDEIK